MGLLPRKSLIGLLILLLLACDASFSMGYPTATVAPPTETLTASPPSLALTLTAIAFNENNANPPSTISAWLPQLTGSDDPRVAAFNATVNELVMTEIETFKAGLVGLSTPPLVTVSALDIQYQVIHQSGDLWSLRFDLAVYVDGAAHPGDLTRTLNYDFAHSKVLGLPDLFLPDANYMEALSEFCSAELALREIGFDATTVGAEPTLENYRNWNISPAGLVITFERAQVAAYAVPAQEVIIPYAALQTLLDPQGPLAAWVK